MKAERGFSISTRMSRFKSPDDVINWIQAQGYEFKQVSGVPLQVQDLWKAAQYRAGNPEQFSGHIIDYEITVSAKTGREPRLYFSRRVFPVLTDDAEPSAQESE